MAQVVLDTSLGRLQGRQMGNQEGGVFYAYQGIPYAKPPVGSRRFKAPEPADPWTGTLDATQEGNPCIQDDFLMKRVVGDEDCLYLNIYTPQNPSEKGHLRPVMFWIHGGGYTMGSGKMEIYGPEYLLMEDVVLVTINYRLGLLGFLRLEDANLGIPGNNGFKDMVQALRWVQQNIRDYHGDPNNVTIFGESAGSSSVHLLTLSPMAKGLFHKAIMQSGCALNQWVRSGPCGPSIAKALGLQSDNEQQILEALQSMPPFGLLDLQRKICGKPEACKTRPIGVVVETPGDESAFLTEEPLDLVLSGKYSHVPMIIGYNDREGMMNHAEAIGMCQKYEVPKEFQRHIPSYYQVPLESKLSKDISGMIRKFYFGQNEPSMEFIDNFYQLETDVIFYRCIYISFINHLKHTSDPLYIYRFSVEGTQNMFKNIAHIKNPGACHADDLGYLFKIRFLPEISKGSQEDIAMHRMVKFWTSFARNADPNPTEKAPHIDVKWTKATKDCLGFLAIGETLESDVDPDVQRIKFWDSVSKLCPSCQEM